MIAMQCFNVSQRLFARFKRLLQIRLLNNRATGNNFELFTVKTLAKYRFEVWCCGGPSDRGVDFRGIWNLKSCKVNILGQCKCYKRRLGPVHIRELEGTLSHEQDNTLGMMVTNRGFTKDAYQHFMSSAFPLALTVLEYTHLNEMDLDTLPWESSLNPETDYPGIIEWDTDSVNSKNVDVEQPLIDASVSASSDCEHYCNQSHCNNNNNFMTNNNISMSTTGTNINSKNSYNNIDSNFDKETLDPQRAVQVKSDISMSGSASSGELSSRELKLFDLNMAARYLVPSIVIGKTMNKNSNSGSPTLLLLENETFTTIT